MHRRSPRVRPPWSPNAWPPDHKGSISIIQIIDIMILMETLRGLDWKAVVPPLLSNAQYIDEDKADFGDDDDAAGPPLAHAEHAL